MFAVGVLWGIAILFALMATFMSITVAARIGLLATAGFLCVPFALLMTLPLLHSHARYIWIDRTARVVYFERVFVFNSFRLPRQVRCYPCPFDDILWVQFTPARGQYREGLTVTTIHARMCFSSVVTDLERVAAVLRPFARGGRVPLSHATWLPVAIGVAIVSGGFMFAFYKGWLP